MSNTKPTAETPTPRTDAALTARYWPDEMRTMERELAAAIRERDEAQAQVLALRQIHHDAHAYVDGAYQYWVEGGQRNMAMHLRWGKEELKKSLSQPAPPAVSKERHDMALALLTRCRNAGEMPYSIYEDIQTLLNGGTVEVVSREEHEQALALIGTYKANWNDAEQDAERLAAALDGMHYRDDGEGREFMLAEAARETALAAHAARKEKVR